MTDAQKPIISTIINSVALALTSFGVLQITTGESTIRRVIMGYTSIMFGMGLELLKYWGMKQKFW